MHSWVTRRESEARRWQVLARAGSWCRQGAAPGRSQAAQQDGWSQGLGRLTAWTGTESSWAWLGWERA